MSHLSTGRVSLLSSRKCERGLESNQPGTHVPLSDQSQERRTNSTEHTCRSLFTWSPLTAYGDKLCLNWLCPPCCPKQAICYYTRTLFRKHWKWSFKSYSTSSRLHASLDEEMFLKVHSLLSSMFQIIEQKHILKSFIMHASW